MPGASRNGNGRAPTGAPDGLRARRRRIAVIGCGHVGLVTAACFAHLGHRVTGIDVDAGLIETLHRNRVPFMEPSLSELVAAGAADGRLSFTTSYSEGLAGAEFVFLCVSTPATPDGAADLSHVRTAVDGIAAALPPWAAPPVIVNKSTLPIGTAEAIHAMLARPATATPQRFRIVSNPEFLRQGSAVHDFFHPERIVVGAGSVEDAEEVVRLYAGIDAPVVVTDARAAELVKYAANAYLAARVSFINEVARLCERLGVEVDAVVRGVSLDSRIGGSFFTPGIGYGGGCLPKDVAALLHTGQSAGAAMRVLASVQETNLAQRRYAAGVIRGILGGLEGRTIGVWGVTYKGGTDDLRESPALDVIALLRYEGAVVRAYDPALPPAVIAGLVDIACRDPVEAARGADCLAVLTDWPQFAAVDLREVRRAMAGNLLYDGRNLLQRAAAEAAGLTYRGVGRPALPAPLAAPAGCDAP